MLRDCRAQLSHARGQPCRHTSPMQRQVGSPGAFHETIIVRGEAESKEGGAGRGANWTRESSRTRNQQCQRRFLLCNSAIARAWRPVYKDYDAVAGLALP